MSATPNFQPSRLRGLQLPTVSIAACLSTVSAAADAIPSQSAPSDLDALTVASYVLTISQIVLLALVCWCLYRALKRKG